MRNTGRNGSRQPSGTARTFEAIETFEAVEFRERSDMRKLMLAAAFALPLVGGTAMAQETVKIGYIDPLSGGGASVGEIGLKTYQFIAEELNAKGGILGKKVEIS